MKNRIFFILLCFSSLLNAQSIVGEWVTYHDKTKSKKSVIEIYKVGDEYFGKIITLFEDPLDSICEKCKGKNKDMPVIGMEFIENLKKDGEEFNDGTILDPKDGKKYKCYLKLLNKNKLKVRGFVGFSIIGRTQYWLRNI
ncbi:MAG: hypothetical protein ACI9SJ_000265 [Flavobacteriaceae bacterium]|jgi:uncharacterized protein (DUF2147 family)|uniref:DUF2147 domain-containing protein n=1 Tax=Candidatus Marifrigoribacter sp. Uisw_064 TaxID=3230970 RepID=UPI003AE087DC